MLGRRYGRVAPRALTQQPPQVPRVADGVAAHVVVEVDEGVAGARPAAEVVGPGRERLDPVAALVLARPPVEPDVAEPAGEARRRVAQEVVLAEGGAVAIEHVAHGIGVPALVSELDGVA